MVALDCPLALAVVDWESSGVLDVDGVATVLPDARAVASADADTLPENERELLPLTDDVDECEA